MVTGGPPRIDPAWRKAPLLLLRFPTIFVSVLAAAAILGVVVAAAPAFLSNAANAALQQELEQMSDDMAGLHVGVYGVPNGICIDRGEGLVCADRGRFAAADRHVRQRAAQVHALGRLSLTSLATNTHVFKDRARASVRLLYRTGAARHIRKLASTDGSGVWIAESNAETLGVEPGDSITVGRGDRAVEVRIRGIYRDLHRDPFSAFWEPMTFQIISPIPDEPPLDRFLIADRSTLLSVTQQLQLQATTSWIFPLDRQGLNLPEARRIAAELQGFQLQATDPLTPMGKALDAINQYGGPEIRTALPGAINRSDGTVAAIEGPVRFISFAGSLVALLVISAAALFSHARRRSEARLLSVQGRTPSWQACKSSVEVVLPVAVGGAAGWLSGLALIGLIGPGRDISPGVAQTALGDVAWWSVAAVVLMGVVFGYRVHRDIQLGESRLRQIVRRFPWELAVLALAAASYYQLRTSTQVIVQNPGQPPSIDLFLFAFPLLFIVGMCGLAIRGLERALPILRRVTTHRSSWAYLALRRLAGLGGVALLLILATSIALGVLTYSATVVATTSTTVRAKAQVLAGSDVAVVVQNPDELGDDHSLSITSVAVSAGEISPGTTRVDLLVIDSEDFAGGAFWDARFAERPLDELLAGLRDEGPRLPAIVAGASLPSKATLETIGVQVPVTVTAEARAWPGMKPNRPVIVVDRERLSQVMQGLGASSTTAFGVEELWAKGDVESVLEALRQEGIVVEATRTARAVADSPVLQSVTWTFGLLRALGVLAGVMAAVGVILFLQAQQHRREVSYALGRRMGLSRHGHRAAVGAELTIILGMSAVIGTVLALIAARLAAGELEPLPGLPPTTLFEVPFDVLGAVAAALVAVTAIGASIVQRRADRTNVAEVMRIATT